VLAALAAVFARVDVGVTECLQESCERLPGLGAFLALGPLSLLRRLARPLQCEHPGSAGSIREGLDETLTLQRLGIEGALYRTLRSTN
jgi:hypothetical protein